jgi:hypothetical protein
VLATYRGNQASFDAFKEAMRARAQEIHPDAVGVFQSWRSCSMVGITFEVPDGEPRWAYIAKRGEEVLDLKVWTFVAKESPPFWKPRRNSKARMAFAATIDAITFTPVDVPGMPTEVMAPGDRGLLVASPRIEPLGDLIWASYSVAADYVEKAGYDAELWTPRKLSEFWAAIEAAEAKEAADA